MRTLSLIGVLFVLAATACATLREPLAESGPTLIIRNEGHRLLDLSYRCVENGPVRRLGTVAPLETAAFFVRPASCTTVYLVSQPLTTRVSDAPAFAVVPLLGGQPVEVFFDVRGFVMTRTSAAAAQ